jgi:Omp85 superfamily domain
MPTCERAIQLVARALSGALLFVAARVGAEPMPTPAAAASTAAGSAAAASAAPASVAPKPDDGWPDLSGFLDTKFGFLPIAMPITEPAVGYGAAAGVAFLSKSLGETSEGLGRPNITFAGGFGTANGSWGAAAADLRYWLEDHVQTMVGGIFASVNLDFYGLGKDSALAEHPLRYNLEPKAGVLRAKYRFGNSSAWAGLGYAFASTKVSFDAPADTPQIPAYDKTSNVGQLTASVFFDTRDNVFTTLDGVYLEGNFSLAGKALGADSTFERASVVAIQYLPLPHDFYFGVRTEGDASFGDAPFYMKPSVTLRGVPAMRYQGDEVFELEAELRWQFWKRLSVLGFMGAADTWNDFEKFEAAEGVLSGGGGVRYEIARKYGIHMGVDVAFSRDTTAFYVQVGSAWARP